MSVSFFSFSFSSILDLRILQVIARGDLFHGLLDGVIHLRHLDLGDDVEAVIWHPQNSLTVWRFDNMEFGSGDPAPRISRPG